jgi:CRP/FNR family transcriptional regulator, cyclic AMP receptor protein
MTTGRSGGGGVTVGPAAAAQFGGKPVQQAKPGAASIDLDPRNMEKVIAFVAMSDAADAREISGMLNRAGVLQVTTQTDLGVIRSLMLETTPDLIVLGADVAPDVFDFVRDIRHSKLGDNPYLMITTLVDNDQITAVKRAMQAGTDDIIVKPLKEEMLLQRLKRVTVNRQAFVVTSDYLGPDRRAKNRPSSIRRIQVLNTMLAKANGHDIQKEEIKAAVEGSVTEVLHARLDSNSYRLGFVCHIIIDAYETNTITPDVKDKILVLVDVLRDAAKTAERINEAELGLVCGSLASQVEEIAERYDNPSERDIKMIQKLTRAVMLVVKPHVPAAQLEKEAREAAQNYLKRKRGDFEKSAEIHRSPADEPVETVDDNSIEIMFVAKGQPVFSQGEPATSAYILASGSIAIYRDIDGKRVPVARLRKGEMFGEMAIIDGTQRRATAIALEDCTLSLIAKDMIEEKMAATDPALRNIMHMWINSIRLVPELLTPKPRNLDDVGRELKDQAAGIASLVQSSKSAAIKREAAAPLSKLQSLISEVGAIVLRGVGTDPRLPSKPTAKELDAAVQAAPTSTP